MKPERWKRIEEIYHRARRCAADERAAFVDEACSGDEELRNEVESLLRADDEAHRFLDTPALNLAAQMIAEQQASFLAGKSISHYEIIEQIGLTTVIIGLSVAGFIGLVWVISWRRICRQLLLPGRRNFPQNLRRSGWYSLPVGIVQVAIENIHQGGIAKARLTRIALDIQRLTCRASNMSAELLD